MGHTHPHDHDHHHESLLSGHDRSVHTDLKLSIENLSVSFGSKTVLSDVSADIAGGELISVIGQNGCGKTTLLKAVAGLVKATGRVLATENGKTLSNSAVAYVPQLTAVQSRLTVFEMVLLGLVNDLSLTVDGKTFDRVDAVLHAMHINELASEPVLSLSGGQKQLVFMAQAFVSSPRVLLLDEPTSALDLRHQLIVMQAARRYTERTGAATVCVVHDLMAAARFSDRLIMLDHGRVRACGTPKEVLKPDMLEAVYRVSTHVGLTEPGFINVVPISENQPLHFGDFGELNVKNQRSVGRDHTGVTLCAVGEIVGNRQLALTAHLHAFNALLPAGNHHALPKREFDRLTARDARIKHRIVHAHNHTGLGFFSGTDLHFINFKLAGFGHFLHLEKLNFKFERCIGRNHAAGTVFAVAVFRSNHKLALAAHLHAGKTFVPPADHLTGTKRKVKRLAARNTRIEHRAVGEFARVMHGDASAFFGFGAIADHDVGNLKRFGHSLVSVV